VAALGLDPASVFKTLVVALDGGPLVVAIVPVGARLNLEALAGALGGKRALPTAIDASALAHPTIHVSTGRRGLELALVPADLVRLTRAAVAPLTAQ